MIDNERTPGRQCLLDDRSPRLCDHQVTFNQQAGHDVRPPQQRHAVCVRLSCFHQFGF